MTDLTDLIERLSALDEKRTPGEWGTISASTGITWAEDESGRAIFDCYCLTSHQEPRPFDNADANAAFITTLANEALPALKAQQEKIGELRALWSTACNEGEKQQAEIERLREALGEHQKQHEMMMDMASRVLDGSPVYSVHKDTKKKTRRKFADVVFEEAKCAAKHAHAALEGGK